VRLAEILARRLPVPPFGVEARGGDGTIESFGAFGLAG
jgi:hypothetical protein